MLVIGTKSYRNLPEQVAENMKQISKLWEKLDGLDVYDNVIVLDNLLDPLSEEELAVVARPVSFIVYNNEVYIKRLTSSSQVFFDKVFTISETAGTITFASDEIVVNYPLGNLTQNSTSEQTYTTTQIDTLLSAKLNSADLLDSVYPIGSIYLSTDGTSPASKFGGTWSQLENKFLLGAGSSYVAGSTGGATSHNHNNGTIRAQFSAYSTDTIDVKATDGDSYWTSNHYLNVTGWGNNARTHLDGIETYGNTGTSDNMPPYLVVYMWERIA